MTVVNTLTDNAFKHWIILSDETVLFTTVPAFYIFNLSTDPQSNETKFKGLLIDLSALTQSIGGINYLKAL